MNMKVITLNKLLLEKGWQLSRNHQEHCVFQHPIRNYSIFLISPDYSKEQIPIGTLNTIFRLAHKTAISSHWSTAIRPLKTIHVVLEKQKKAIWGRIETPGLLATTRGHCIDDVVNRLRSLLIDDITEHNSAAGSIIESIPFEVVYDTTAVWDLFRQLKATHVAQQTGIDIELIGQFIAGSTFPSVEQAERLEKSIHELGRQLMQLSIR